MKFSADQRVNNDEVLIIVIVNSEPIKQPPNYNHYPGRAEPTNNLNQ